MIRYVLPFLLVTALCGFLLHSLEPQPDQFPASIGGE